MSAAPDGSAGTPRHPAEARAIAILDGLQELVFYQDAEQRVLWANEAACTATGLSRDELIGRRCREILSGWVVSCSDCAAARALETGEPQDAEKAGRHGEIWRIRAVPVADARGQAAGVVVTVLEVTEQRRAEDALREREAVERRFRERLTGLLEVCNELSAIELHDGLCWRAVELGRERLGFDRVSIWFATDDPGQIAGSFGIDESGALRDERGLRAPVGWGTAMRQILDGTISSALRTGRRLYNNRAEAIGRGTQMVAGLWDGERMIGCISVDNLLSQAPVTDQDLSLLRLYASALGHLCSRARVGEALRGSNEAERLFRDQLTALHECCTELSGLDTLDGLCRRAIELGRERLGFDRLGIWFLTEDRDVLEGSFGVDEAGALRDERCRRVRVEPGSPIEEVLHHRIPSALQPASRLFDDRMGVVGNGSAIVAALWDGHEVIGAISTDNLVRREPLTARHRDLLTLYAASLGHLCSRRRAEAHVQLLSRIVGQMKDAVILSDDIPCIRYVNDAFTDLYGYRRDEVVGQPSGRLFGGSPEDAEALYRQWREASAGSGQFTIEYQDRRKDGTLFWVSNAFAEVELGAPPRRYWLGIVRDVTGRKEAEAALLDYQGKLRSLAAELSLAEERERRRIAADLHDRVGQNLAAAKVNLGLLRAAVAEPSDAQHLEEALELVERCIQDTWSLTFELSPPTLYELGVPSALRWLAQQIEQQHGLPVELDDAGGPRLLSPDAQGLVYRAARELLTNVVKHARATRARVVYRREGDDATLAVEDDGVGYHTTQAEPHAAKAGGFGLFHIRERLAQLGGRLDIDSQPGQGTRITLTVPIPDTPDPAEAAPHADPDPPG